MKGIVLAGGSGTRLYPLTVSTSKQLLPVYDTPMVFYALSVLTEAGIRDILIISTPSDIGKFKQLLGDGSDFGIKISYEVQPSPDGLAQAFIIGEKFIEGDACALILGDNLFHGNDFNHMLREAVIDAERGKSTIFGYPVKNPQRFGVVAFDSEGNVIGISSITFSQGIPTVQCILLKQYRGKGYGTNILTELTNQLFIEGYERVELLISPRNKSSIASAEKAGYHLDYSNVEFNLDNEDSMYLTYYKNNYRKIR